MPVSLPGLERIARAIHGEYLLKARSQGHTIADNPTMVPWEELPDHVKRSSFSQAADIPRKIALIGCEIVPAQDPDLSEEKFSFTRDELELLSPVEHDRWSRERLEAGWKYGPVKDISKKLTPYVVPYEELSEEIKDLDRNAVMKIPVVLEAAGYVIKRVGQ